jgi:hypothetical protein
VSSVQGPEPTRVGRTASPRSLFRVLVIAAMLLVTALVATPAYAQDAGDGAGNPPVTSDPPPTPPTDPSATDSAPTPPGTTTDPPAAETPPADPPSTPDTGSGQTAAPVSTADDTMPKQPAHPTGDELTTSTAASGNSAAALSSQTPGAGSNSAESKSGYSDSWLGQDTFIVSKTATKDRDRAVTIRRSRFAGLFVLGASTRATRMEAKARRNHETEKVSAFGSGPPTPGNPLPGQNPFFNLLSGPGGIAASLMLASVLAVLGAAFVLPRDRLKAFRTPTVTWRPLAYVPPIELPG